MYKILLCLRYLRSRYIALASVISVMLGVATMIVVNSVMAGFGTEMRSRLHGILADVIIETTSLDGVDDIDHHLQLIDEAAGDYIAAKTTTVELPGMITFSWGGETVTRLVQIIGIDPPTKSQVSPLVDSLESYTDRKRNDGSVRRALHDRDHIPDWKLSPEDAEYRRSWAAYQQPEPDEASFVPPDAESSELIGPAPLDANAATADVADPFANNPFNEEQQAVDPAAPLDGRVYVGAGLIELPYRDSDTGELRMIRMIEPGEDVKLSTVKAGRPDIAHFAATVVDTFRSGMSEYDSSLVFVNLAYLQEQRGMITPQTGEGAITSIQIKLKDYAQADTVVSLLEAKLDPRYFTVRTWEAKQGPLLAAVEVERAILNVLLFLIIAVAGFGILAIFFMIVVEKTRDIGILKALGASSNGVMSIFLSYGLGLGIVGSSVGVALGLVFVHYINEIEKGLSWLTGRKVFDETIYYFPEIPTEVSPFTVAWVAVGAVAIAVMASILPARRAARLHPVEALRYE